MSQNKVFAEYTITAATPQPCANCQSSDLGVAYRVATSARHRDPKRPVRRLATGMDRSTVAAGHTPRTGCRHTP